jgi:hypothetical protein
MVDIAQLPEPAKPMRPVWVWIATVAFLLGMALLASIFTNPSASISDFDTGTSIGP